MRLLLDTHVLIWALLEPGRLPRSARANLEDTNNEVLFSAASIWEIAIKSGLRRADLNFQSLQIFDEAREVGFIELPVRADAATLVADLPFHHRDPFDRILVAQAMAETIRLWTADRQLIPYSELVTLIA